MLRKIHEKMFGRWQDRSIDPVIKLTKPGTYFLSAKAFGLKGIVGGYHSWIVHVDAFKRQYVIELTELEALKIQGSTWAQPMFDGKYGEQDKTIYISNRDGGQMWFGAKPTIWLELHMVNLTLIKLLRLLRQYPEMGLPFHFMNRNCNTFVSWATAIINEKFKLKLHLSPQTFWGAKRQKYWQRKFSKVRKR